MNYPMNQNEKNFLMIYLHSCKNVVSIEKKKTRNFHIIIILLFTEKVLRLIEYQSWLNTYLIYVSKTKLIGNFLFFRTHEMFISDELFRLVVSKGGLVEVINKKLWREDTKGLNLPSSITSAAFTLRTQYV